MVREHDTGSEDGSFFVNVPVTDVEYLGHSPRDHHRTCVDKGDHGKVFHRPLPALIHLPTKIPNGTDTRAHAPSTSRTITVSPPDMLCEGLYSTHESEEHAHATRVEHCLYRTLHHDRTPSGERINTHDYNTPVYRHPNDAAVFAPTIPSTFNPCPDCHRCTRAQVITPNTPSVGAPTTA